MARRSASAVLAMEERGMTMRSVLTDAAVRNAMIVHAAFGGSTNLILHLPAVAHAAGLRRPTVDDWTRVNRETPRIVDALPNGPKMFPTVQVFLAGGVPEAMLHLRRAGLLDTSVVTVTGATLDTVLDWWEQSERRVTLRRVLQDRDGIDPGDVIMSPDVARRRGLTSTVTFPKGNLAPGGSVIKSTAIDASVVDADGIYRKTGPARVFRTEKSAVKAIKDGKIRPGDVVVLMCRGPMGSGMEEIYEITSALRYLDFGKEVAVITDARFSGVSTGACIGHVTPEALAGGPLGKVKEGDVIEITIDRVRLEGSVNMLFNGSAEEGARVLAERDAVTSVDPELPPQTRLWAALQDASGGTWGGCVFDVDAIERRLAKTAPGATV
jgi:putative YjhG/YagF family dehydratase